jgi:hypothetical protein
MLAEVPDPDVVVGTVADATARARFRRYWAFTSPGIAMIRRLSLQPLKRDPERRAGAAPLPARDHAW